MADQDRMSQQDSLVKSPQNNQYTYTAKKQKIEQDNDKKYIVGAFNRMQTNPILASARDYRLLQKTLGNQQVAQMIQAKLTVGAHDNYFEREADRIAEQVTTRLTPDQISPDAQNTANITPLTPGTMSSINVSPAGEAEDLDQKILLRQTAGKQLPENTRHFMESQFGADFSKVRIHTSHEAHELNRTMNSEAFTHGNAIYMAEGRYQPDSTSGQRLLAHELTHVIQQGALTTGQTVQTVQCKGGWLSRLFGRKKEEQGQKPAVTPTAAPQLIRQQQWLRATPTQAQQTIAPSVQWQSAYPQQRPRQEQVPPESSGNYSADESASAAPLASVSVYNTPESPGPVSASQEESSGTYSTPESPELAFAPQEESSGTYSTPETPGPASVPQEESSGTYSTPESPEPAAAPQEESSGTYSTPESLEPAAAPQEESSGTYSTPESPEPAAAPQEESSGTYYSGGGSASAAEFTASGSGTGHSVAPDVDEDEDDSPNLTMPKMAQYEGETEQTGIWGRQGMKPTYYHPTDQPNPYRLGIRDGRLTQGENVLDTQGILPEFNKDKAHRHMFTMSGTGEFYSAGVHQGFQEHGRVHHTTMMGGQEAAAAGELQVNQGRLEVLSDASGHYRPGAAMTYQALRNLQAQGVSTDAANVELSGKREGEKALSLSATEMMAYQPEMETALEEARDYRRTHSLSGSYREHQESEMRDILGQPERKIRAAHARKDTMLQELLQKTAARRQEADQSGPAAAHGQRDMTKFEYAEAMKGTYQASSAMSRRITPEQAEQQRADLTAHWQRQQQRAAGLSSTAGTAISPPPVTVPVAPPTGVVFSEAGSYVSAEAEHQAAPPSTMPEAPSSRAVFSEAGNYYTPRKQDEDKD